MQGYTIGLQLFIFSCILNSSEGVVITRWDYIYTQQMSTLLHPVTALWKGSGCALDWQVGAANHAVSCGVAVVSPFAAALEQDLKD